MDFLFYQIRYIFRLVTRNFFLNFDPQRSQLLQILRQTSDNLKPLENFSVWIPCHFAFSNNPIQNKLLAAEPPTCQLSAELRTSAHFQHSTFECSDVKPRALSFQAERYEEKGWYLSMFAGDCCMLWRLVTDLCGGGDRWGAGMRGRAREWCILLASGRRGPRFIPPGERRFSMGRLWNTQKRVSKLNATNE